MNTHVRDNLVALKAPPSDQYTAELSDGTSSATFVDVDATNLSLTITTTGGDVRIGYNGWCDNTFDLFLDVDIDGARFQNTSNGIMRNNTTNQNMSFVVVKAGLSAGSHTFKLQFKGDGSNTNSLVSTSFWVSESG
jgi:hypothetical protein